MKSSIVEKYLPIMPEDYNLPNAILTECFKKYEKKVAFIEITFQPRQGGVNYMNWKRIINIGKDSLYYFYQIRRRMIQAEKEGEFVK